MPRASPTPRPLNASAYTNNTTRADNGYSSFFAPTVVVVAMALFLLSMSSDFAGQLVVSGSSSSSSFVRSGQDLHASPLTTVVHHLRSSMEVARTAARQLRDLYGEEDADELFRSLHFIQSSSYIQNKMARAVMEAHSNSNHSRFVVSFSGTSVTAGHDNYLNQSYPMVFQRVAQPAFRAAGVDLVVRNHAMGNNPAIPSSLCVGSQLGTDSDVVAWEFGMMVASDQRLSWIELWIRNAVSLPKQPAFMMVDPGEGARKPIDDKGTLPTDAREGEPHPYERDFGGLLEHYKEFGPHTQAMYEAVWKLDVKDRYNFNALVVQDKPTPHPASWHPGPGGHELRGNILAYHYLTLLAGALQDCVDALEAAAQAGGDSTTKIMQKLMEAPPPIAMPPPKECEPELCLHPHHCLMTFEPKAEGDLLEALVKGQDVSSQRLMSGEGADNSKWHVELFETDSSAVAYARGLGLVYLDLKFILKGTSQAGPITFAINKKHEGYLFICSPPGLWGHLPDNCGLIDKDLEVEVDGQAMEWESKGEWYHGKKFDTSICRTFQRQVSAGAHTVTLKSKTTDNRYIAVASIIYQ